MATAIFPPLYDEFLDFLVERVTPAEILAFKASDEAQRRAERLTERNQAGTLTPEEAAELEQMLELELLLSVLKAKALVALSAQ